MFDVSTLNSGIHGEDFVKSNHSLSTYDFNTTYSFPFSDSFEDMIDTLSIQIIACFICGLMMFFNNAYSLLVCFYEKYGSDPMKRSLKNQLMVQLWYCLLLSNNVCTPLFTCRIIFGPLHLYISALFSFSYNFMITWGLLSLTQLLVIKALLLFKFSYMAGVNDDFMGYFLLYLNLGSLFLCHTSR